MDIGIASTHVVSVTYIQVVLLDRYNKRTTMVNPFLSLSTLHIRIVDIFIHNCTF
jgi:hypothetical protein